MAQVFSAGAISSLLYFIQLFNFIPLSKFLISMSNTKTIPTSIAPWLSVRNSAKAVAFYKSAFGAIETYRLEDTDENAVVKLSVEFISFT